MSDRTHARKTLDEMAEVIDILRKKLDDEQRKGGRQGYDCRVAETFEVLEEIAREGFMHAAGEHVTAVHADWSEALDSA